MEIRLLGDLSTQRIDDDELAGRALCFADLPDEVEIGNRRVVAPDDIELCVPGEFGRATGNEPVGSCPGLAAHAAAEGAAVKLRRTEAIEEARRHAVAGEKAVRAGIVERHDRLRTPPADDFGDTLVDLVERQLPGDALELAGALGSGATQRVEKALRTVDK